MVIGYHLVWTAYGWWLPNDPRGSSPHEIRVEKIESLGELRTGRKRIQPPSRVIRGFYEEARDLLKHPLLILSDEDIALVAQAFAQTIGERAYVCYGCAIMPDHVHCLVGRHRDRAEGITEALQRDSRQALIETGRRAPTHPVWGGTGWKVFQNTHQGMRPIVEYIQRNPIKARRPVQNWPFVQP